MFYVKGYSKNIYLAKYNYIHLFYIINIPKL